MVGAAVGACGVLAGRAFSLQVESSAKVSTALGVLRGEQVPGARVFRGVPFAVPPVGPLRFRAPGKPQPWTGERDATRFAASPMQVGEPGVQHSEDCLYLNLWAPEGKGPHPVFVWIHGGGFTGGHAFEPMYDGTALAREGIVCITVGYRLGVFGFLDVEPMLGSGYAGSANNGLRDLMAALEWVRDHVSDFGGDPGLVTIGGESAGAKLADILMGTPSASQLFHQVISESGGAERVWPQKVAREVSQGFAAQWRASSGNGEAALLTAPGETLIEAQQAFIERWPQHFPLRPELDAQLLPQLPVLSIAAGSTRGKRLLIGTNREESALFVGPHPEHDASSAQLGNMSQAGFEAVYDKYKRVYPELTVEQRRIRALTAEEYWIPSMRVVDAHLKGGGSAWMYRLDFSEAAGRLRGYAYHSLDVGLVWNRPNTGIGNNAEEAALAQQVHLAWAAFMRGVAPAAPGLPAWPAYTNGLRQTMILERVSHVVEQPSEGELRLWDGVL
jgi:para-nitrobenzyl esterase